MERIKTILLIVLLRGKYYLRSLLSILSWPFKLVKVLIDDYKFEKTHPDFMERYIEKRRIQNEEAEFNRCNEINAIREKIAINIGVMLACTQEFIKSSNPKRKPKKNDIPSDQVEKIFSIAQQEAINGVIDCKKLGASFANNFAEQIKVLSISSFQSVAEANKSTDQLLDILNDYEFGKPTEQ